MKQRRIVLAILAFVLVLGASIAPAMAYFTTYTQARGGFTVHLQTTTGIDERFEDWTKYVTITNTEGKPVFVRARAFAGSTYELTYGGDGWTAGADGWYTYDAPLAEGQSTAELTVHIGNLPEATENAQIGVAVVYESTPVLYKEDGTAYADWTMTLEKGGNAG